VADALSGYEIVPSSDGANVDVRSAPMLDSDHRAATPWAVRWLTWPIMFVANLAVVAVAITLRWNLNFALAATTVAFAMTLIALEFRYPLDDRWRMTLRTFFGRDIKYFAAGGATGAFTNFALAALGISLATGRVGPITEWPVWLAAPLLIVAFDFLQYWQHRWSHEADNAVKHYLWRTHAPHHLPEEVYVLMHPAGHPFNFFLIQGLLRLPLFYALGAAPEAVYAASAIIGLQGLVSHCNVDLRAGVFNYLFAGTELHRYHHSGDPTEAKNFAVALSLLDVLFGTLVYRPGEVPKRLGVARPDAYPQSREFWKTMLIPLRRGGYGGPGR
jgi:sterol desaturase/sphingolipid hydroxylase (fatty acid hydroxylase superfamily)